MSSTFSWQFHSQFCLCQKHGQYKSVFHQWNKQMNPGNQCHFWCPKKFTVGLITKCRIDQVVASQPWCKPWNLHHYTAGISSTWQVFSAAICTASCIYHGKNNIRNTEVLARENMPNLEALLAEMWLWWTGHVFLLIAKNRSIRWTKVWEVMMRWSKIPLYRLHQEWPESNAYHCKQLGTAGSNDLYWNNNNLNTEAHQLPARIDQETWLLHD